MSEVGGVKRKRAGGPRTNTGCLTCRQRRVKCDEEKPVCGKCTKAGEKCRGWQPAERERAVVTATKSRRYRGSIFDVLDIKMYDLEFLVPGGPEERKAVHYFCIHAAPEMAGYFSTDIISRFILPRCHHDPIVRQAVKALSLAHLEYSTADSVCAEAGLEWLSEKTVMEYNKAVRKLRRYIGETKELSRAAVLVCCYLFYCYELLRGDGAAARDHLRHGVEILRSWAVEKSRTWGRYCIRKKPELDELDHLEVYFSWLDLGVTIHDNTHLPQMTPDPAAVNKALGSLKEDQPFEDEYHARQHLLFINSMCYSFFTRHAQYRDWDARNVPAEIVQAKQAINFQYRSWESHMSAYERKTGIGTVGLEERHLTSPSERGEVMGLRLARVYAYAGRMCLEEMFPDDKTDVPFDHNPMKLLRLTKNALELSSIDRKEDRSFLRRKFIPEPGMIAPMMMLARKTTMPDVRAEAIALASTAEGIEGLCTSYAVKQEIDAASLALKRVELVPVQ